MRSRLSSSLRGEGTQAGAGSRMAARRSCFRGIPPNRSNRDNALGRVVLGDAADAGTSSWCDSSGLVSQSQAGGRSMSKGSGTTRGDRRRNERRAMLRGLLPRHGAVIGIDLGEDKQAIAVVDHDVRVLARKTVKVKAYQLGEALDWAVAQARAAGFGHVAVACEPTGSRWLQVQRLCRERGLQLVCIQPLVTHIAREQQDFTRHKTDESDCVMIARLAIELYCYVPEELDERWAELRYLGRRRAALITAQTASVRRIRDF